MSRITDFPVQPRITEFGKVLEFNYPLISLGLTVVGIIKADKNGGHASCLLNRWFPALHGTYRFISMQIVDIDDEFYIDIDVKGRCPICELTRDLLIPNGADMFVPSILANTTSQTQEGVKANG